MNAQLTMNEKRFLNDFVGSVHETKAIPGFPLLYAGVISLGGLALLTAAVIITLNNFNDYIVYWVFLPGWIGGMGAILCGYFLVKYFRKTKEREKLAAIITKVLQDN